MTDAILSVVVETVIKGLVRILSNRVLNKTDEEAITSAAADHLRNGNELCRGRMIPMSPHLITKIKIIYRNCQMEIRNPLMEASRMGLADMVWGFIECSKETATNLHTLRRGEPRDFLWLRNSRRESALDIAISDNHIEVAKILLSNASHGDLVSEWNSKGGMILLPLLRDPKYDGFIFYMLEDARGAEMGASTSRSIHTQQGRERRMYLEKLNHGLLELNPNKNTILHIVSKYGDVNYVNDIIQTHPSLISCRNSEGETPVYVAAREGHVDVLQIMVDHLKRNHLDIESLFRRPGDNQNALHIAIQNHHAAVVFWLLEEIPQLANQDNNLKESALFLAAERGYFEIVKLILRKCNDKSFSGPNGKTALHAAAISNSTECVKYLLDKMPSLLNEKDENGWTPLCYAVRYNSLLATKELLNVDHSIGYELITYDNTITTSALHIAASRGHCEALKVLMSICFGSSEFIDSEGRNILHVATESGKTKVIELIFQDDSSLLNQKDNNGNTPAHLLAASNFEMLEMVIDARVDIHALNNENRTPLDMISSDEKKDRLIKAIAMSTNGPIKTTASSPNISMGNLYEKELEGKQKKSIAKFKMVDNLVLVATLIATATFAAAFTVPGGFDSNSGSKQGTPYLLRKAAFQVFVIADAIAFSCSCSVLVAHIVLLIYRNRYDETDEAEQKYIDARIVIMYFFTGVALLAMLIAFVTGFYVVLLPSLWLAIFVCALSILIVVVSLSD